MAQLAKPRRETKDAHERRVFVEFCRAAGLPVIPESIQQPQPDPPDIIADIEGQGRVTFELVRLNHDDELHSRKLLTESSYFLSEQFAKVADPQRTRLAAMYADAHVLVQFTATADAGRRKRALPFLWAFLESRPAGAKGELYRVYPWQVTCAPAELQMVYVSRWPEKHAGPEFNCQSASYAYPIQIERVVEKLRTPYGRKGSLELLAYVDFGEISFARDLPALEAAVREHLPGSAFRRVWAFEEMLNRVIAIN